MTQYRKYYPQRRAKARAKLARRRRHLHRYMLSVGCIDCGYNDHPAALEWDHIDPSEKIGAVSQMMSHNLKRLMKEVRKCEVRCSNCHSIRTFNQNLAGRPRIDTTEEEN